MYRLRIRNSSLRVIMPIRSLRKYARSGWTGIVQWNRHFRPGSVLTCNSWEAPASLFFGHGSSPVNVRGKGTISFHFGFVLKLFCEDSSGIRDKASPCNDFPGISSIFFQGTQYVSFEIAQMINPDTFGRTHTVYNRGRLLNNSTIENSVY